MDSGTQTSQVHTENESTEPCVNRDEFNEICRRLYRPRQTKTMRKVGCDRMVRYLRGLEPPAQGSWRYRMEKKGYSLVSFPPLGLEDVLCVKGSETDGVIERGLYRQWRRVVPVEEFYDVLMETHVKVQLHGGYKNLLKAVQRNYAGIPREAAVRFVSLCSVCQRNPQQRSRTAKAIEANRDKVIKIPCSTKAFNVRTQVDLIKMSTNSDGGYTHVGMYMDHWTQFVTLFPMMGNSVEHVAYGLASSVFPYFGPPSFLHSPEGKEFASQVIHHSMVTWKGSQVVSVPVGRPGLERLGKVMEEVRSSLISKVDARAEAEDMHPPLPWASWLGKIMFDINNEPNKETGRSPYSRVFERTIGMPEMGEPSTPIRDLAFKDRRRRAAQQFAPPPPPLHRAQLQAQAQMDGQGSGLTFLIGAGVAQNYPAFFLQQTPVLIQTDTEPTTQMVLAEEADTILPVAATEVLADSQLVPGPQSFTTSYISPSGEVQNFIINVQPAI